MNSVSVHHSQQGQGLLGQVVVIFIKRLDHFKRKIWNIEFLRDLHPLLVLESAIFPGNEFLRNERLFFCVEGLNYITDGYFIDDHRYWVSSIMSRAIEEVRSLIISS